MPYSLEIEIKGKTPTNSADAKHWRTRHAQREIWKNLVANHCHRKEPVAPLERARVHITRFSSGTVDPANLGEAAKFLLDGLILAGIIVDDNELCIGYPILDSGYAPPKKPYIRIRVDELPPLNQLPTEIIEIPSYGDDGKTLQRIVQEIGAAYHTQGAGLYFQPNELSVIYRVATGQMLHVESLEDDPYSHDD